ncbi:MAG TPA: HD domain-containing protein [Steroidobacteraceae bacterium]
MNKCLGVSIAAISLGVSIATAAPAASAPVTDWRVTVRDFAASRFKNPAWGFSHCLRDYALARDLAAADHVAIDDDVLYAAAYLHDIAAFAPWEDPKSDHSDVGARVVDTVLKGTGFPMEKIDAVRGAIRTHMYYRDPLGPEALYLHDADALDWLGAIGVARIMALVDPHGGKPDAPKAAAMLVDNLNKVPARVLSPAGRARVPERKAELEKFLADLKRESDDFRSL